LLNGLLGHVQGLASNPGGASAILDQVKGALGSAQGKESVMGWVNKLSDMAHDPKAAEALTGVADKLKAQGTVHFSPYSKFHQLESK